MQVRSCGWKRLRSYKLVSIFRQAASIAEDASTRLRLGQIEKRQKALEGGGDDRTRGPRLYRRGRLPKRRNSHGTEQEHPGDHPPGARPGGAAAGRGPGLRLPVRPGLGGEGVLRGAPPRGAPDPGAGGLGGHLPGEPASEIPPRLGEAAVAADQLRRGGGVCPARGAGGKYPPHQRHRRLWPGHFGVYAGGAAGAFEEIGALPGRPEAGGLGVPGQRGVGVRRHGAGAGHGGHRRGIRTALQGPGGQGHRGAAQ